jgi:hypothetical protein
MYKKNEYVNRGSYKHHTKIGEKLHRDTGRAPDNKLGHLAVYILPNITEIIKKTRTFKLEMIPIQNALRDLLRNRS